MKSLNRTIWEDMMPEYIVSWDYGYGQEFELIDTKDEAEAEDYAYQRWREGVESNPDYGVEVTNPSEDQKEEYGV